MPRIHELIELIDDRSMPSAYFRNFDDSIRDEPTKKKAWVARESELQRLDGEAWKSLKLEARPYLTTRDPIRGWEQLISILNQARAYNYLLDEGYSSIRFIPRKPGKARKTPDLEAAKGGKQVLCEVKTIHISQAEACRRKSGGGGQTESSLDKGFLTKLTSTLLTAEKQMQAYVPTNSAKRLAFLVLNFDDFFAEYKAQYFEQIDRYLEQQPNPGIDVVFYNQRTTFHDPVVMQCASVINEAG